MLPITCTILRQLVDKIHLATNNPYNRTLFKALFLMSFYACTRAGELVLSSEPTHVLFLRNVNLVTLPNIGQAFELTFNTFKHSSSPARMLLHPIRGSEYCPVQALVNFLGVRPKTPGQLFVQLNKTPVTRSTFANFLKVCLHLSGLQSMHYNTHSFRIGRATQLAADNASAETIKAVGRWKSSAYVKYIRPMHTVLPT